jgi:pyridoxine 5-phosphate synthase
MMADGLMKLGVNIDHVATLRNARQVAYPCPVLAAIQAHEAGADHITAHLREDRRHIQDRDIEKLSKLKEIKLNLEMAPTEEMRSLALSILPFAICLVPERRQELTTEGGLDIVKKKHELEAYLEPLRQKNIRLCAFITPDSASIQTAKALHLDAVELSTAYYSEAKEPQDIQEHYQRLEKAAKQAHAYGLECHAGHGLTLASTPLIAQILEISELNIGHALIGEAIFHGMKEAVTLFKHIILQARNIKNSNNIMP